METCGSICKTSCRFHDLGTWLRIPSQLKAVRRGKEKNNAPRTRQEKKKEKKRGKHEKHARQHRILCPDPAGRRQNSDVCRVPKQQDSPAWRGEAVRETDQKAKGAFKPALRAGMRRLIGRGWRCRVFLCPSCLLPSDDILPCIVALPSSCSSSSSSYSSYSSASLPLFCLLTLVFLVG